MAANSGASSQALPLPKGGGATRGLGDSFTPDFNRGTGSYAIEITLPSGFRDATPRLGLNYTSAGGNGPFGFGWNLPVPEIRVDTDNGVPDYRNPTFLMGGETLVDIGGGVFQPRIENAFSRISRVGDGWEVTDKSGTVTVLGASANTRVSGIVAGVERTFVWLAERQRDTSGNEIAFAYLRDGSRLHLERVVYAQFEVVLEYAARPDPSVDRRAGFAVESNLRCERIEVRRPSATNPVIRRYSLHYDNDADSPSLLTRVEMESFKTQPDGSVLAGVGPPTTLIYAAFEPTVRRFVAVGEDLADPPGPLGESGRELVDIDGNGLPDVMEVGVGRPRVWRNVGGGRLAPPRPLDELPTPLNMRASTAFFDVDGQGTADLVELEPDQVRYYPNNGDGRFERPRFLGGASPLTLDFPDRDTRFGDINGDGRVDIIKSTARGLVSWINRGGDLGFENPIVTPTGRDRDASPDVSLSSPGVFVTDMTGDGLPDLVHVRSGFVEYWPSLGGGRFDRRVVMRAPPVLPANVDFGRVFLADVDGTGTSDVVVAGDDHITVWRNIGGMRFTAPTVVRGVPATSAATVRLADMLGQGRAGVLWSDVRSSRVRGYRFLSFGAERAHVLVAIDDGVGSETRIQYGSSSDHAVRDAARGEPWQTRLPMPVPVVERTARVDQVTGAEDVLEIEYHNGHWDPVARRFRGFGRVTARRLGDADADDHFEEHRYLVGAPGEPVIAGLGLNERAVEMVRRGQLVESNYRDRSPDAEPLRIERSEWLVRGIGVGVDGITILHPHVTATEVHNVEGGLHPRVVRAEFQYDAFGNVLVERRTGSAPAGDDAGEPVAELEARTVMEYAVNTVTHVVDRVARTIRRDENNNVIAEIRNYYDGPEFVGLPLGQTTAGLLVRQEEVVLTTAEADVLYGVDAVDFGGLGYHDADRVDGSAAIAVNRTRLAHTPTGMVSRRMDASGNATIMGYDSDGLLVSRVENAAGHVKTARYDSGWQLIEERTEATGSTTHYRYDGLGRTRAIIRPGDTPTFPTLELEHSHDQLPTSVTITKRRTSGTAESYRKRVHYDGFGRLLQERSLVEGDDVRVSGSVTYNRRGDAVAKGQPQFRTGLDFEPPNVLPTTPRHRYRYDGIGRVREATNPQGGVFRVDYTPWSAAHHDVIDNDPMHAHAGTPRISHFDAFGRPVGVTLIADATTSHRTTYGYDLLGRLISTTDLEGRPAVERVAYDARGQRLVIEHALAGTRTMLWDADGRLVRYTDGRGSIVTRGYDTVGRLVEETVDGVVQERYHWDLTPTTQGLLGRVDDQAGDVSFVYDARGNVVGKTRVITGETYQLAYESDSAEMHSRTVFPDGSEAVIERWGDGRVRRVIGFVDEITYDGAGRLSQITHSNGIDELIEFGQSDVVDRMRVLRGAATLRDVSLTMDGLGRVLRVEETGPAPATEAHDFDSLGRLTTFERTTPATTTSWAYDYDADGNLLRSDEVGTDAFQYDFSIPGALVGRELAGGAVEAITHDDAGHLTGLPGTTFTHDARGRLVRAENIDGTVVEMIYDYRGARVSKSVSGPGGSFTSRYVDEVFEDRAGTTTAYVFAAGRLVAHVRGGGRRSLHTDHRGTVVLVTRPDGTVDRRNWFGPYGTSEVGVAVDSDPSFTGARFDPETGLFYMNNRHYSPTLSRFTAPDPLFLARPERELDEPQAHNLYGYARGDPVDYIDPLGLGFWSTLGKVLAGIVIVAFTIAAIAVVIWAIAVAWPYLLAGAAIGAVIGGIAGGWEGALMGAMMGATIGVNIAIFWPAGIVTALGVIPQVREKGWYKSLSGWGSWFMPASWPGHILGLGVFLANGTADVFGSDRQIESVSFDWNHGQILTAGGEYSGTPFPWLGLEEAPAHNVGGFSFWTNDSWSTAGESWTGVETMLDVGGRSYGLQHETGHMLSNALFGFFQGIVQVIESGKDHNDRLFEKIAESNVNDTDRDPYGDEEPIWH